MSRLDVLQAMYVEKRLCIDTWESNTPDKARHQGHLYSDKAPGTAALALPAFAAAAGIASSQGVEPDSKTGWLVTSWTACAFSQGLPVAIGAAAMFGWLRRFVRARAALLTIVALTLGSLPLPYATLLFSHAQVIGLVGIAIWALGLYPEHEELCLPGRRPRSGTAAWRMGLAGFCLGLALASEYTAGIVVGALVVSVLVRQWREARVLEARNGAKEFDSSGLKASSGASECGPPAVRLRPLVGFFVAAIPPLLLIPAYSWATIGTPFDLPYSYQASFPEMKEGLYAIKWPDAENLGRLLIGPTRGLIFWTPFLIMAGFGWWWIAGERPRWLWLTYAVPVLHMLVISGRVWDWQAGYTVSARYMAPIIPLLALRCAIGTQRWPKLGATLALVSIGLMTLATITDACPDSRFYNPLTELHIPKLLRGEFSYTLGTEVFGLNPWVSVGLYYAILIGGIAWLWRLAGQADAQATKDAPVKLGQPRGAE
ncbi:MAG: hypothetical protein M5U12_36220 [Verrucomicrobia bacterium]|nr:hypothetical protein [Verrucomicrobiota bacterium]